MAQVVEGGNHCRKFAGAKFQLAEHTYAVPMSMHQQLRRKLLQALREKGNLPTNNCVVLMEGGKSKNLYDTDRECLFRQESYFNYLFGVSDPDFYGALTVNDERSILFAPRLPSEYSVWMGKILSTEEIKQKYEVDEVYYVDELASVLKGMGEQLVLLTMKGLNTDSDAEFQPATFKGIDQFRVNHELLFPLLRECRVIKTKEELDLLRYVVDVSSRAHIEVMKKCHPGLMEFQLESEFLHHIYYYGGCRFTAYTSICGCGPNSAILHYGHQGAPNNRLLKSGDMCLFDMGGEYHCYVSDITCSFPANGKFTEDQRAIYEAVLEANRQVIAKLKPGVSWVDMHTLAYRIILERLLDIGILKRRVGEENLSKEVIVDRLLEANVGAIFMPHGLGHFMGLDTHDVGGYGEGATPRSATPGYRSLRTTRHMQEGMVITVEPGCYFIETQLAKAVQDEKIKDFINVPVLDRFRTFGGVRIEDDVLVTSDGCELLSKLIPRTVAEIESLMNPKST